MTSTEARHILLRYRPGTSDETDPDVRAALAQARRDPVLDGWLATHRRFQADVRDRLNSLEVPEGLREQILSERRARSLSNRVPHRVVWGALAAVLLLIGAAYFLTPNADPAPGLDTFRLRMVKAALRGYSMDLATNDVGAVRTYLESRQAHGDWRSPTGLDALPLLGCAVLTWQGEPASMICYGETRPEVWLFVVDSATLPDAPAAGDPVVETVNRVTTVSWSQDGQTYLLAGRGDPAEVLPLLEPRI